MIKYDMTAAQALAFCKNDPTKISRVPDRLITSQIANIVVAHNGYLIRYVPMKLRSKAMCLLALKTRPHKYEYFPNEIRDELIAFKIKGRGIVRAEANAEIEKLFNPIINLFCKNAWIKRDEMFQVTNDHRIALTRQCFAYIIHSLCPVYYNKVMQFIFVKWHRTTMYNMHKTFDNLLISEYSKAVEMYNRTAIEMEQYFVEKNTFIEIVNILKKVHGKEKGK